MESKAPTLKTLCFTGHRPVPGLYPYNISDPIRVNVRARLTKELIGCISNGYQTFISGMAIGFDTDAALTVLSLRDDMQVPGIYLTCAVPFEDCYKKWRRDDIETYKRILAAANSVITICKPGYEPWKMMERNKWMVDQSDHVLALWRGTKGGTANTIAYALDQGKPVRNLLIADVNTARNKLAQSA